MEKWEYLTKFLHADAKSKEVKEFVKDKFDMKRPPRFTPEAMIPELDELGEDGWELIHMEPVAGVGGKGDVRFEGGSSWSNVYFGVFKRRKDQPQMAYSQPPYQPQPVYQPPQPIQPLAPPTPPTQPGTPTAPMTPPTAQE